MDKIIVYVDDAAHAQQQLTPMKSREQTGRPVAATHWVLVACAPRMTHRISKWVSHSARESWRAKWSDKLFGELTPGLLASGDTVTTVLAKGPLPELTDRLKAEHDTSRVLDARSQVMAFRAQTQAERLRDRLTALGHDVRLVDFPDYTTHIGEEILTELHTEIQVAKRRLLLVEASLLVVGTAVWGFGDIPYTYFLACKA